MKALLTAILITFSCISVLPAQWLNTTTILPASPLDCDSTSALIAGNLPGTNYGITGSHSVNGLNIEITLNVMSLGPGLTVITPFTFVEKLDTLPAGTYTLKTYYILSGNLQDSLTQSFTVTSCCATTANFDIGDTSICLGDTINFTNMSSGAIGSSWKENGALLSTGTNLMHVFNSIGVQEIRLVSDGSACADSHAVSISVTDVSAAWNSTPIGALMESFSSTDTNAVTWFWDFGDLITSTMQSPSHTFPASGTYNTCLTVTNMNGCTNTICDSVTVTDVSIKPETEQFVKLYPNPVIDYLHLNASGMQFPLEVNILDLQGKVLIKRTELVKEFEMNLSKLSNGIYFIRLSDSKHTIVRKINKR